MRRKKGLIIDQSDICYEEECEEIGFEAPGEIKGNFIAKTFPLKDIEQVLINSVPDNPINKVIVEEMLEILKEYNKIKGE